MIIDENDSIQVEFSPLLVAQEASQLLRLPKATIYEHARTGVIPCIRIGRAVRFRRSDLEAFLSGEFK